MIVSVIKETTFFHILHSRSLGGVLRKTLRTGFRRTFAGKARASSYYLVGHGFSSFPATIAVFSYHSPKDVYSTSSSLLAVIVFNYDCHYNVDQSARTYKYISFLSRIRRTLILPRYTSGRFRKSLFSASKGFSKPKLRLLFSFRTILLTFSFIKARYKYHTASSLEVVRQSYFVYAHKFPPLEVTNPDILSRASRYAAARRQAFFYC